MRAELIGLKTDISTEAFSKLPPEERKRHIRTILLKIINKNPKGITITGLKKLSGFDIRTIAKHVEYLTATREIYNFEIGARNVIYYPNGRLMHSSTNEYEIGGKFYNFSLLRSMFGNFLYIQEKEKDEYNTFIVKGGLVIRKDSIQDFIEKLQEVEINGNQQSEN